MTTLRQIELRCPVCDNEFKSQSVVSTNAFGGKRTDFHERAAGTQPLAYLVHMCSACGYSGAEADFTAATDVSPGLKQHVLEELAPLLHLLHRHSTMRRAEEGQRRDVGPDLATEQLWRPLHISQSRKPAMVEAGRAPREHAVSVPGSHQPRQ